MAKALKELYDAQYVESLAKSLIAKGVETTINEFVDLVMDSNWTDLELKGRTSRLREVLKRVINRPFKEATKILIEIAPEFTGYHGMFLPEYVEVYGRDYWEDSMLALEELTVFSSAEFAIRPFILQDTLKAMKQMRKWAKSENEHLRRLASEGCRPKLPWAMQLNNFKKDPRPVIEILDILNKDQSLYVRKSVANNLNDISKDHPLLAIDTSKRWLKESHPSTVWICKHGMRTLLKSGEKNALDLFSYGDINEVKNFKLVSFSPLVTESDPLQFSFEFKIEKTVKIRFEYGINFLGKTGKLGRKVFKISEGDYEAGNYEVLKSHSFKAISTRRYIEGFHSLELILNGKVFEKLPFIYWQKKSPYQIYMFLTVNNTIYTGITTDINRRFHEHRFDKRKGAKYTKANCPQKILFLEASENRSMAQKREAELKKLSRKEKEKLIRRN